MGVAGFLCALAGAAMVFVPGLHDLAFLPAGLAVVLAGVGWSQAKKLGSPKGLCIAGVILGALVCMSTL